MHTHQRIVFGNMGEGRRNPKQETEEDKKYKFNSLIFEIGANWKFVTELMKKFKSGKLREIDILERDWLNFMMENHIEIDIYEDSDKFVDALFKK